MSVKLGHKRLPDNEQHLGPQSPPDVQVIRKACGTNSEPLLEQR